MVTKAESGCPVGERGLGATAPNGGVEGGGHPPHGCAPQQPFLCRVASEQSGSFFFRSFLISFSSRLGGVCAALPRPRPPYGGVSWGAGCAPQQPFPSSSPAGSKVAIGSKRTTIGSPCSWPAITGLIGGSWV